MQNANCHSLYCRTLRFVSLSFSEAAHAYFFHSKNFAIVTKFSHSLAEILLMCKTVTAIQPAIIPQWQKYWFLHINERTCHVALELDKTLNIQGLISVFDKIKYEVHRELHFVTIDWQ